MLYRSIPIGYPLRVSLAANIAALRRALVPRLTQTDLGDRLGVGQGAVSKWESGLSEPDASTAPRLALALQVTLDRLYEGVATDYDQQRSVLAPPSTVVDRETGVRALRDSLNAARHERDHHQAIIQRAGRMTQELLRVLLPPDTAATVRSNMRTAVNARTRQIALEQIAQKKRTRRDPNDTRSGGQSKR